MIYGIGNTENRCCCFMTGCYCDSEVEIGTIALSVRGAAATVYDEGTAVAGTLFMFEGSGKRIFFWLVFCLCVWLC